MCVCVCVCVYMYMYIYIYSNLTALVYVLLPFIDMYLYYIHSLLGTIADYNACAEKPMHQPQVQMHTTTSFAPN